ncbi:hypothetical protein CVT26_012875 [Gymnopilus dilepis]|uniref:Uncharacterized protein n=1 Tax=Gymnopilus dilepis TaxID=231916 RepID=A0A409YP27_9AGAR|nr:hypothetical protein CVT26_012875 [Gymnopilus dilepis]
MHNITPTDTNRVIQGESMNVGLDFSGAYYLGEGFALSYPSGLNGGLDFTQFHVRNRMYSTRIILIVPFQSDPPSSVPPPSSSELPALPLNIDTTWSEGNERQQLEEANYSASETAPYVVNFVNKGQIVHFSVPLSQPIGTHFHRPDPVVNHTGMNNASKGSFAPHHLTTIGHHAQNFLGTPFGKMSARNSGSFKYTGPGFNMDRAAHLRGEASQQIISNQIGAAGQRISSELSPVELHKAQAPNHGRRRPALDRSMQASSSSVRRKNIAQESNKISGKRKLHPVEDEDVSEQALVATQGRSKRHKMNPSLSPLQLSLRSLPSIPPRAYDNRGMVPPRAQVATASLTQPAQHIHGNYRLIRLSAPVQGAPLPYPLPPAPTWPPPPLQKPPSMQLPALTYPAGPALNIGIRAGKNPYFMSSRMRRGIESDEVPLAHPWIARVRQGESSESLPTTDMPDYSETEGRESEEKTVQPPVQDLEWGNLDLPRDWRRGDAW